MTMTTCSGLDYLYYTRSNYRVKTEWSLPGVSGVLVLEFGPILAWYEFPATEEFVVVFDIFFV